MSGYENSFCPSCGVAITSVPGDGQAFCHNCGTRRATLPAAACGRCGRPLQQNQAFCANCGQKAVIAGGFSVAVGAGQFNQGVAVKKNQTPLILGIAGAAFLIIMVIIIAAFSGGGSPDFRRLFPDYAGKVWCTIAKDGSYMEVDTNWLDKDNYMDMDAYYAVEQINMRLGFSSAVFKKMGQTRSIDGRLSESNGVYTVSWTYHPDKGMQALYEKNR